MVKANKFQLELRKNKTKRFKISPECNFDPVLLSLNTQNANLADHLVTHGQGKIKQTRSMIKKDFSKEALSKQNTKAWLLPRFHTTCPPYCIWCIIVLFCSVDSAFVPSGLSGGCLSFLRFLWHAVTRSISTPPS